jgi:16S rRNA (adenine1518-N6/adenine1519-N6)-dimethyltransferase
VTTTTRPRKELGQHWLTDSRILARIARAAAIEEGDTVIEVGPGKGALTRFLTDKAAHLTLVEVDSALAAALREKYADLTNLRVIEGDVLDIPVTDLVSAGGGGLPYVVVGNLPYFIGSPIVRKFLTARIPPRSLTVTLQAEVAERMAAAPGKMSYLSVETQLLAEARVLFRVPPSAFRPPPKVHSAVLRLDLRESPEVEVDDQSRFLELVRAGFATPRKQVRNSLAVGLRASPADVDKVLMAASIDSSLRPGALTLDDWRSIYLAYASSISA